MKTMKRMMAVILALVLLCIGVPFVGAEGEEDYTPIYTKEDLDNIRLNMSGKYKLMNDIIFTDDDFEKGGDFYNSGKGWSPIGTQTSKFTGTFDGNGCGIYHLCFNYQDEDGIGLFGFASSASIDNLTVAGNLVGKGSCGLIVGSAQGLRMSNCKAMGSVIASENYIGGLIGTATTYVSTLQNCFFNGIVSGANRVGGIVGEFSSSCSYSNSISSCLAKGSVSGGNYVGGICGYIGGGVDSRPTHDETIIQNFYFNENQAEVSGEKAVGGLIGYVYASYSVYTRYNGTVFVGQWHQYSYYSISSCFNRGPISASIENVGGIVGTFSGNSSSKSSVVSKVYNVGQITSEGSKGAITSGGTNFSISEGNVFYLDECIENGTGNYGISKSEDQLRKQSTYENWDFETVWSIDKDAEYRYPTLRGVSDQSEIVIPSNCQHKHTQLQNEKEATCSEDGYTGDVVCLDCSDTLEHGTVILSLGHIEQSFTTPSTCAENGFTVTYCTRCGETLSHEILPRLAHTWNDGEVTAEPTCTAQGVKTFTCSGCGATYTEPVDMLAHDWDEGVVTKEPSCTESGVMTFTCATGGETRTEPIDKLDHKIVLVPGKAATCEEPGLTDGWQCETCQKWFAEQQPIDPTGHDMQIQSYVYPTCEEGGYAPFVCSRCGYTEKTDPEPALGHDYQPTYEWAKDNRTVTASLVCIRCDDVQAKETVGTFQKMVESTCTNPGQVTYTSEGFVNKAFYVQTKTIEIAQKPHVTMQIREVSPTCDKEGVGSYWTCSTCDGIFEDEAATKPLTEPPVLPKLPHTPGEPVTENETAATCTAEGSYDTVVYCFACGAELSRETTETPVLDHADADNDGHCDACGEQMQGGDHCKVCGKIHNGGFFDKLTGFLHRIIGLFK